MRAARSVLVASAFSAALLLNVWSPASQSLAAESSGVASAKVSPKAKKAAPRARRTPPRAVSRTGKAVVSRRAIVTPRTKRVVTKLPHTTKRLVRKTPSGVARLTRQTIRRAPTNLALANKGLRQKPGLSKPAGVVHDPKHRAGKSGWMHRHHPFFFKHDGHRWHRHYYTFLVGGLWYWYWYDVIADDDPAALVYTDVILPACYLDSDECVEPGEIIAPAILEDRATEEDMARCAAEFRSFDARTGTYVMYGGAVRVCPYLA
jgi:hypothetical protein